MCEREVMTAREVGPVALTARSVTPSPGKSRQSPGRVGKKKPKPCLRKSHDHHRDRGPANICSSRSTVFTEVCFREKLRAGCFMRGRVIRRNVAEGFLRLSRCLGCQPLSPMLKGKKNLWKRMDVGLSQLLQPPRLLALVCARCRASREPRGK